MRADALERLDLYRVIVDEVVANIRELLDDRLYNKLVWASLKAVYSGFITYHNDWELAETFYNSITRRVFSTVGVDPQIEFVATDYETPPTQSTQAIYRVYGPETTLTLLFERILQDYAHQAPYEDLSRDAALAASCLARRLEEAGALRLVDRLEIIHAPFYRGMAAYLVGRLYSGSQMLPFALALLHSPQGVIVDALLLDEDSVSILFSFARAYFHVEADRPYDLAQFLKTIIPRKKTAELYTSLGFNKHGKTEFYRDLLHHLASSKEQFQVARGQRGMVMAVFDMPGYDMVFKVIKDRFSQPKSTTRQEVMAKYDLVFRHDRAGRLIDAHSFEHLQFERDRFDEALLEELLEEAGKTIHLEEDSVIVSHAYVERRVIPLDIYVQAAHQTAAETAVIDYGQAIKDLAATNIFPGDMLLKNFGVTRHGRVVFYDYDELTWLTSCRFRRIPPAPSYDDELSDQPWFNVAPDDVFPEEFSHFIGLTGRLEEVFLAHHADLLDVAFWQETQKKLRAGELIHIYPYDASQQLRPGSVTPVANLQRAGK